MRFDRVLVELGTGQPVLFGDEFGARPWLNLPLKPGAVSSDAYRSTAGPPMSPVPGTVAAPIGTLDIISTPPATTMSACPDTTAAAAVEMAC